MQKMQIVSSKSIVGVVLVLILTLILSLSCYNMNYAQASVGEKSYCCATLEDDFADDRVIVVFTKAVSKQNKQYSARDFLGIQCKAVENLTEYTGALAQDMLSAKSTYTLDYIEENIDAIEKAENFRQVVCINLKEHSKQKVLDTINQLQKRSDVYYAGPAYVLTASNTVPPSEFNGVVPQWALKKISAEQAWSITTGDSEVKVGVLDSGIDATHEDLVNKVDRSLSRDFTSETEIVVSEPTDDFGHGTAVSGIIGAEANNMYLQMDGTQQQLFNATVGVNWNTKLVSLRVLDHEGHGVTSDVAKQ